MASCACRLVPTRRMVLPWPESSLTKRAASRNIFRVFWRSIMWMPLRSPKMYSFIFGFQRRVWWPKWTPASSSSFIVISTAKFPPNRIAVCGGGSRRQRTAYCRLLAGRDLSGPTRVNPLELGLAPDRAGGPQKLSLRELEALTGTLLSVLLAFLHSRIARQEPVFAQRRAQLRIEPRNRPRQTHAHRSRLPAHAAAMGRHHHVHLVGDIREFQRLDRVMLPRVIRKILLHRPAVDRELAGPRTQEHARYRFLAPSRSQKPSLCARNGRTRRTQRSSSKTPHSACSLRWVTA